MWATKPLAHISFYCKNFPDYPQMKVSIFNLLPVRSGTEDGWVEALGRGSVPPDLPQSPSVPITTTPSQQSQKSKCSKHRARYTMVQIPGLLWRSDHQWQLSPPSEKCWVIFPGRNHDLCSFLCPSEQNPPPPPPWSQGLHKFSYVWFDLYTRHSDGLRKDEIPHSTPAKAPWL